MQVGLREADRKIRIVPKMLTRRSSPAKSTSTHAIAFLSQNICLGNKNSVIAVFYWIEVFDELCGVVKSLLWLCG